MAIHELGVPLFAQKTPYWCWAASVEMVLAYHGATANKAPPKQCAIATVNDHNPNNKLDCCIKKNRRYDACRASNPNAALRYFGPKYKVTLLPYPGNNKITFESIQEQIDAKQPFIATWVYPSDAKPLGLHSVVVIGYQIIHGKRFVIINNPAPVGIGSRCAISYECFSKQHVSQLYCALPPSFVIGPPPPPIARVTTLDAFQHIAIQRVRARVEDGHRMGAPLPVFEIMMHEVAQETERTIERLGDRERESTHAIYPVLAAQHLVTTFEVRRSGKSSPTKDPTWDLCCLGGDDLYHRLDSVAARCRLKPASFALSEPALGMWFVGGERKGIKLVPVSDVHDVGLKEGSELSVGELAAKLRSYARI